MYLTFVTDNGDGYPVEIDPGMELGNVMALLEAESGIRVEEQTIYFEGRLLDDTSKTMEQLGLGHDSMLLLRRRPSVAKQTGTSDAEMIREQVLGDPWLMSQLRERQPELANAAQNDPARFAHLYREHSQRTAAAELERQRALELLTADPFDVDAQRRIEEQIRQEQIDENMQHAFDYRPEAFGRVTMLYVPVEVNGHPVKAFVDSGAQQTIISPECAEACNITRFVDKRFSGIARGVGTAKIFGRVHSAQIKVSDLYLPCSFTVIEGRDVDLLLGLDMLKAHQACIDLEKNVLRIQGREVHFLSEHELPEKARALDLIEDPHSPPAASTSTVETRSSTENFASSSAQGQFRSPSSLGGSSFPGSGQRLGPTPPTSNTSGSQPNAGQSTSSRFPEKSIQTLMDLGVSKEEAIRLLETANGNVDVAASMLFF